jgi:hypothetical protein
LIIQRRAVASRSFLGNTGTNTYDFSNEARNIQIIHYGVPDHDSSKRAGKISWKSNFDVYFQANWISAGMGKDISSNYRTLDLRLSRQDIEALDSETTNFSIQLARMAVFRPSYRYRIIQYYVVLCADQEDRTPSYKQPEYLLIFKYPLQLSTASV